MLRISYLPLFTGAYTLAHKSQVPNTKYQIPDKYLKLELIQTITRICWDLVLGIWDLMVAGVRGSRIRLQVFPQITNLQ